MNAVELAQSFIKLCYDCPIVGILSCDIHGVIGNAGKLPWYIPDDVKFFQTITEGRVVIMGRKTLYSLPKSLLKTRFAIVFSRNASQNKRDIKYVSCLTQFKKLQLSIAKPWFVIGGAEIAELFLKNKLISKFILTKINGQYEGDTKLNIALLSNWLIEMKYAYPTHEVQLLYPPIFQKPVTSRAVPFLRL